MVLLQSHGNVSCFRRSTYPRLCTGSALTEPTFWSSGTTKSHTAVAWLPFVRLEDFVGSDAWSTYSIALTLLPDRLRSCFVISIKVSAEWVVYFQSSRPEVSHTKGYSIWNSQASQSLKSFGVQRAPIRMPRKAINSFPFSSSGSLPCSSCCSENSQMLIPSKLFSEFNKFHEEYPVPRVLGPFPFLLVQKPPWSLAFNLFGAGNFLTSAARRARQRFARLMNCKSSC